MAIRTSITVVIMEFDLAMTYMFRVFEYSANLQNLTRTLFNHETKSCLSLHTPCGELSLDTSHTFYQETSYNNLTLRPVPERMIYFLAS